MDDLKLNILLIFGTFYLEAVEPKRSAFRGVHWSKQRKKWQVRITYDSKQHHVGCFDNEEPAARAYDAAARQHHGERAQLNFAAGNSESNGPPVVLSMKRKRQRKPEGGRCNSK